MVPIARPLHLAFFEFIPSILPGNAELRPVDPADARLDNGELEWQLVAGGRLLAVYVAGNPDGDLDSLESNIAKVRSYGVPVIAYWTRQAQQRRVPRGADLVGIEAYRLAGEPMSDFEARVRGAIVRCPLAALICQCYTSNAGQTTELGSLVPVYARLARDYARVKSLLVFSGSGRATGYQDHPEVHALWHELAMTIPVIKSPTTTVRRFDGLMRPGWRMELEDTNNPDLGYRVSLEVRANGSLHATIRNLIGWNTTGVERRVL